MPQVFKVGSYVIFFWLDEGKPLEPIHVHISTGTPQPDSTKIWIRKSGKALVANNRSKISDRDLRKLIRIIEANTDEIKTRWLDYFEDIRYYC